SGKLFAEEKGTCQELVAMARTKITSRQDNDQMKLKLASNEELLKNKRKPSTASNRRKNKKVAMDFEKTHCDEVEAENSEIRMDVNETENVDGGNSSHLVARDGSGDDNYGEGMEEDIDGEGMEEDVNGEGIEEDVDNDGENESDGDQSKEMEEVGANKKRKGKAQTKDLEANEGKFCGGPMDSSILYGYKCHVAHDVWIEKVKDPKEEEGDGKEDNEKGKGKGKKKKKKKKTDEGSSEEEIERAVRGYILFFFGCTVVLADQPSCRSGNLESIQKRSRRLPVGGYYILQWGTISISVIKKQTGKISMQGIVTQDRECRDHYIIRSSENRVPLSQTPWDCVDTYLEWYNAISHPYLVNFNPRDPPPYITLYRPPPCDWVVTLKIRYSGVEVPALLAKSMVLEKNMGQGLSVF
ncbi:hypothetical protein IFM89_014851, partial [Coptis chinensis]